MSRNLGTLIDLNTSAAQTLLIDCREADNPRSWNGSELEQQSNAIARALLRQGLVRGDRVAIMSANRAEYLTAYYGAMRAGLIAVPINTRLPPETVEYVLRDSGAKFAFVDAPRAHLCAADITAVNFDTPSFAAFLDPGDFDAIEPSADEVAMFLYTSGSTGKPKGVPLTHFGHRWVIDKRVAPNVDYPRERLLVAAPLYHMNALAIAKFAASVGACVVLLPEFSAAAYITAIEQFRCTWLTSVPTMLAKVAQQGDLLARTDLSSVTSVRMGSAPVTASLIERLTKIFPDARIQLGYGTTEAGPVGFVAHPQGLPTPMLALGVADPDVALRLVDSEGQQADQGVLEIKCAALTPGYHNLPEKTASVMTADGFYLTGDVMRRDADGFYYFVGRDDDMFVCNGENVFPEEVERLIEGHPQVAQACVVPVADDVRGHMPVAFVVLREGASIAADEIKQHTISRGPAYQHPRHVFFEAELPLAGTNKVDRNFLIQEASRRL
jgi:long-chain acyl-CoA synthetase